MTSTEEEVRDLEGNLLTGIDANLEIKAKKKFSAENQKKAIDWVEKILKEKVDNGLAKYFETGEKFCDLMNFFFPESIKKINRNPSGIAGHQKIQENFTAYTVQCKKIGIPEIDLLTKQDLNGKTTTGLNSVINHIFSLARIVEREVKEYKGPLLEHTKRTPVSSPAVQRRDASEETKPSSSLKSSAEPDLEHMSKKERKATLRQQKKATIKAKKEEKMSEKKRKEEEKKRKKEEEKKRKEEEKRRKEEEKRKKKEKKATLRAQKKGKGEPERRPTMAEKLAEKKDEPAVPKGSNHEVQPELEREKKVVSPASSNVAQKVGGSPGLKSSQGADEHKETAWLKKKASGSSPFPLKFAASFAWKSSVMFILGEGVTEGAIFAYETTGLGAWKKHSVGHMPSPRKNFALTVCGHNLVIHGGQPLKSSDDAAVLNDLFILNLENMKQFTQPRVTGDVPCARTQHKMCAMGDKVYLFGGKDENGKPLNDFYALDINSHVWTAVKDSGRHKPPAPRYGHVMETIGESIFVVTGHKEQECINDAHIFDTKKQAWSPVKDLYAQAPCPMPPRYNSTSCVVEARNKRGQKKPHILIFGGNGKFENAPLFDYWKLDLASAVAGALPFSSERGPSRSDTMTACVMANKIDFAWIASDSELFVWHSEIVEPPTKTELNHSMIESGRKARPLTEDQRRAQEKAQRERKAQEAEVEAAMRQGKRPTISSPTGEAPRSVKDILKKGEMLEEEKRRSSTRSMSTGVKPVSLMWNHVKAKGENPFPMGSGHSVEFIGANKILSFQNGLVHQLDTSGMRKWDVLKLGGTKPVPRKYHSSVFTNNKFLIFGGAGINGDENDSGVEHKGDLLNDVFFVNTSTMKTWTKPRVQGTPPSARMMSAAFLSGDGKKMMVYGGKTSEGAADDMFQLDTDKNQWSAFSYSNDDEKPSARYWHACSTVGNVMYLYGGTGDGSTPNADAFYSFDMASKKWTKLDSGNVPVRFGATLYTISKTKLLLLGGQTAPGHFVGDLWIYDTKASSWQQYSRESAGIADAMDMAVASVSATKCFYFSSSDVFCLLADKLEPGTGVCITKPPAATSTEPAKEEGKEEEPDKKPAEEAEEKHAAEGEQPAAEQSEEPKTEEAEQEE